MRALITGGAGFIRSKGAPSNVGLDEIIRKMADHVRKGDLNRRA